MHSVSLPRSHRRRGPDRRPLLVRWLDDARTARRRVARRRRLQRHVQLAAIGYAPAAIGLTLLRKRLRIAPWLSVAIASGTPLAVAAALPPRSRTRYIGVGMTYMCCSPTSSCAIRSSCRARREGSPPPTT